MVSGDGACDYDAGLSARSKVVFEWRLQSIAGDMQQYRVFPRCDNVFRRGVPVPDCVTKASISPVELERIATESVVRAQRRLEELLGCSVSNITCQYMGVVGSSGVNIDAALSLHSKVAFEWIIHIGDCEWKEEVQGYLKNIELRLVPLPSCYVTHRRLHASAHTAGQNASESYRCKIRCVYPMLFLLVCGASVSIMVSNRWSWLQVRHERH